MTAPDFRTIPTFLFLRDVTDGRVVCTSRVDAAEMQRRAIAEPFTGTVRLLDGVTGQPRDFVVTDGENADAVQLLKYTSPAALLAAQPVEA